MSTQNVTNWKLNAGLFLGGQALSLIGSMLVQYAIMWHITLTLQSGVAIMIYVIVGLLPTSLIAPFGGVWADRYNRKHLIVLSDSGIALASAVVAAALLSGYSEMWMLFACAGIRAAGQGIHSPAESAFIPQITPAEHLSKVNGINSSIQSAAMIVSPMAGAALMTFMPLHAIFLIDVVTAAIGVSIVAFYVKTPYVQAIASISEKAKTGFGREFREGIRYIVHHPFVGRIMLISAIFCIAISPAAMLSPLQVTRDWDTAIWRLSAIEITFSVGMMLGGLIVGFWGGFRNKIYSMALACVAAGLTVAGLGLFDNFWLYVLCMALNGFFTPFYNVPSMVLFQTKVEPAFLGRVFGAFSMVTSMIMPAAMLVFGPLADVVSIDILMVVSGIVIVGLGAWFVADRELRKAGREGG